MTVIGTACGAFRLTVSESKTEIICLQTKCRRHVPFTVTGAGQVYKQTVEFGVPGRGYQRRLGPQTCRCEASNPEGMGVLRAVLDGNLRSSECAFAPEGVDAESQGSRDAIVRVCHVESEQGLLRQATEGPPPDAPPIPRLAGAKTQRSHPVLCQRVSQHRFRERGNDGTQTKGTVRGLRARMREERLPRRVMV